VKYLEAELGGELAAGEEAGAGRHHHHRAHPHCSHTTERSTLTRQLDNTTSYSPVEVECRLQWNGTDYAGVTVVLPGC
jgi:hypothetical protein